MEHKNKYAEYKTNNKLGKVSQDDTDWIKEQDDIAKLKKVFQ